ncbi:MAG: DUF1588 domain-containing protein, partial [Planctomycetales bacterium]|nr:DUF1588 domain-containing protein [Planctomycetales bacterium]
MLVIVGAALVASPACAKEPPGEVARLLQTYCADCHGADAREGNVSFTKLAELDLDARLELLNQAQDQLFFQLMPPEEAPQPEAKERAVLAGWIRSELRKHRASKLDEKLKYPSYGNYVDHEQLFSGQIDAAPFTPVRRWLVSPQIFHERVMDVFKLEGWDRDALKHSEFAGVTNPFLLPDHSGVRYYDLDALNGGHLLVMLGNANWIADRQLLIARHLGADRRAIQFENPRDRWMPRQFPGSYEAFRRILLHDGAPTEAELHAAIGEQFDCVLRRPPTDNESSRYLKLLRSAIELAGNAQGLRQMMVAVLLESEFLYRLEFGGGEPDADGRRMLTPREASFAISYSLGDRGPDPLLVAAANAGELASRQDYERHVRRLLDDQQYYRGQIDPTLNGKHYRSNETSHPKLVRFFREFFGYPGALRVFKDSNRSEGKYSNPGRGSQGTPGWLTLEADRFVTLHVEKDQQVFENLLLSDEFFVYHDKDNQTGRQIVEEWRSVFERLKDTDWRTDPEGVLAAHLEFLTSCKSLRFNDKSAGELVNYMHYFEESFGQGRTPFTTAPWKHGYTLHHAPFYSLPPTPQIGRYGSWKSTKYQANLTPREFWDYPPEQPFRIEHRKGILTHPAWLIAHSSNFHSDPVRRGRWIREKLLAGRVPDVPITVDAQVPEDPHKTFRQRMVEVTASEQCWKCHRQMNPLGLSFEMFDDFGRYRTEESLEHPDNLLSSGDGKS